MSLVKIIQYLCKQSKKQKCFFFLFSYIVLNRGDNIKDYIEYYYRFKNIDIIKKDNYFYFIHNNIKYVFTPQIRDINELEEISKVISYYNNSDELVRNIYNSLVTSVNDYNYILIKIKKNVVIDDNLLLNKRYIDKSSYMYIVRSNWVELWSKKIDYIEYQLRHIESKYYLVRDSIQYYIGLAENAISYVRDTFSLNNKDNLVVSHIRIIDVDFNNPQNIIIDYYSRDISEYLKYLFYYNKYDYISISELLKKANLNEFSLRLIYGRMFFVTFYFDMFDKIINNAVSENELKKILNRVVEYEDFIKNIYSIITEIVLIPEISWM